MNLDATFWLGIILGAFAGKYLPQAIELAADRTRKAVASRAASRINTKEIDLAVVGYYDERGTADALYVTCFGPGESRVPFITDPKLLIPKRALERADLTQLLTYIPDSNFVEHSDPS